jgi:hypothetical protein
MSAIAVEQRTAPVRAIEVSASQVAAAIRFPARGARWSAVARPWA